MRRLELKLLHEGGIDRVLEFFVALGVALFGKTKAYCEKHSIFVIYRPLCMFPQLSNLEMQQPFLPIYRDASSGNRRFSSSRNSLRCTIFSDAAFSSRQDGRSLTR